PADGAPGARADTGRLSGRGLGASMTVRRADRTAPDGQSAMDGAWRWPGGAGWARESGSATQCGVQLVGEIAWPTRPDVRGLAEVPAGGRRANAADPGLGPYTDRVLHRQPGRAVDR